MGLMDKAKQALKGRSETVEKGIDKAVSEANKRTKGKYGAQLTARAEDLKERARRLDDERAERGRGPVGHEPPEASGATDPAGPAGPVGDIDPPGGETPPPR